MNKELAGEILGALYWCRCLKISPKRWRKRIADKLRNNGRMEMYGTETFCATWDYLEAQGLIF